MMRDNDEVFVNTSQDASVFDLALGSFLSAASSWTKVDVSPKSLVTAIEILPNDQQSRVCLQPGIYEDCVIENTVSCLFLSDVSLDTTAQVSVDGDKSNCNLHEQVLPGFAVFHGPIKIDAHAPLAFHSVWFANLVEVTGEGPVFFSQCIFGASPKCTRNDFSSSPYASVHLSVDGVCTFYECDFSHVCGLVDLAGNGEVPALTACGQTELKIISCSFLGPGVVSTALALLDSATLEADYMTVVNCGGHGLIVGGGSNAVMIRSVFCSNGGGVWVKENGRLAIRDSSFEMIQHGQSSLLLTDHSYCSVRDTGLLSPAVIPQSSGRSVVMVRDYAYLSLTACDLYWVKDTECDGTSQVVQHQLPCDAPVAGHKRDHTEDTGLFHVVLREGSRATFTRCVFRLPLMDEADGQCASAAILLRSVPQANALPLYAVKNTVLYGCPVDSNTPGLNQETDVTQLQFMCGLVLPNSANEERSKGMQSVVSMWIYSNRFLKADRTPLTDASLAYSSYDMYCKVTGSSPIPPDTITDDDGASYHSTSSLSALLWGQQQDVTQRSGSVDRSKSVTDLCLTMRRSLHKVADTCSRNSIDGHRGNSIGASSTATSLTCYSGSEENDNSNFDDDDDDYDDDSGEEKNIVVKPSRPPPPLPAPPPPTPKGEEQKEVDENVIEGSKETITTPLFHNDCSLSVCTSSIPTKSFQAPLLRREMCQSRLEAKQSTNTPGESISLESRVSNDENSETRNLKSTPCSMASASLLSGKPQKGKGNKQLPIALSENKKCSPPSLSSAPRRDDKKSLSRKVERTGLKHQVKSGDSLRHRMPNGRHLPHKAKRANGAQECRIQSAVTTCSSQYYSEFSSFHPLSSNRRRPYTNPEKMSSDCVFNTSGGKRGDTGTSDACPCDGKLLRNVLHRRLGLYSSREEYEQVFYAKEHSEEISSCSTGDDDEVRRGKRRVLPQRADVESLSDDVRKRYTSPSDHGAKWGTSSFGSSFSRGYRSYNSSYRDGGWATLRLYDDFWNKCHKNQLFTELLSELRRDQRERERLSQGEMESQVQRMYRRSTRERRSSNSERVAGAARNYVLQQRSTRHTQNGLTPRGKVEEAKYSSTFPQVTGKGGDRGEDLNDGDGRRTW